MCFFAGWAWCDELPSKEAKLLVQSRPETSYPPEVYDEWRLRAKAQKGVTPDLLIMIKQEKDWELIGGILATLRERDDVTPEMLEDLKKPLNDILSKDPHSDMLLTNYASGVIALLGNFPTDENEELLLSILDKQGGTYNMAVFLSLASSGTEKSLIPLKKILKETNHLSGSRGDPVFLENAIESIEKRVAANQRKVGRKAGRRDASTDSENSGGNVSTETNFDPKQKSSDDRKSMSQWLVWGGLVLGGMILLLKFIQKRPI